MSKQLTIYIEACRDCPHCEEVAGPRIGRCDIKQEHKINPSKEPPQDCPLEDVATEQYEHTPH